MEIGNKHLPLSFQYYDSNMELLKQETSQDQKGVIIGFHKLQCPNDLSDLANKEPKITLFDSISQYFKGMIGGSQNPELKDNMKLYSEADKIQNARYVFIQQKRLKSVKLN